MAENALVKPVRICWSREKCTNCLSCMVVCAERHTGMSALSRSRIQLLVTLPYGEATAQYCRQCRSSPCAAACPREAIGFNEQHRVWLVDNELCTGCGDCVEACKFNAIKVDPVTELAVKCDLCLGAARCVEICPANALTVKTQSGRGNNAE